MYTGHNILSMLSNSHIFHISSNLFKFPQAQKSPYYIFHPRQKVSGSLWRLLSQNFAATGVAVLSFQFSTIQFSLPATKIHQTRGKLQRDKKIKYMIKNSLIRIPTLLTSCPIGEKKARHTNFSTV